MSHYLSPKEDGSFTIIEHDDNLIVRVGGVTPIPIDTKEAKELLKQDRKDLKFDKNLGKVREKTREEKIVKKDKDVL